MDETCEMNPATPPTPPPPPAQELTLTQELSLAAHNALKEVVPESKRDKKIGTDARLLQIVEADARKSPEDYKIYLYGAIGDAYEDVNVRQLNAATAAAMDRLEDILADERVLGPSDSKAGDVATAARSTRLSQNNMEIPSSSSMGVSPGEKRKRAVAGNRPKKLKKNHQKRAAK